MRIQRYIARDMRSALAQVREALGPDAVILSSGKIGDEVEVVAAVDAEIAQAVANAPPAIRESTSRDSVAREPVRYEPPRQEPRHEALRYDVARAEAARAEATRAEATRTEAARIVASDARVTELRPLDTKPRRASSQISESLAPAVSAALLAAAPPAPVVTAGQ